MRRGASVAFDQQLALRIDPPHDSGRGLGASLPHREVSMRECLQLRDRQRAATRGCAPERGHDSRQNFGRGDAIAQSGGVADLPGRREVDADAQRDPLGSRVAPACLEQNSPELAARDIQVVGLLQRDGRAREPVERGREREAGSDRQQLYRHALPRSLDEGEPDA